MLQGTKVVLALPHGMGTSLGQETLLDGPSEGEPPAPRLPQSEEEVHLAFTRYLAPPRTVWRSLQEQTGAGGAGCRFTVRAPDALYLPAKMIHAVESVATAGAVSAVSFFYGLKNSSAGR